MKGFAEYGFPESHAVSFSLLAYASSYLKCHYPAAFYISVLNSQPMGFYSPHALLQSARREGIELRPISLARSTWDHRLEHDGNDGYAIRLGFRLVKGLSQRSANRIIIARARGLRWGSFAEFAAATNLDRKEITALAACNLFEAYGDSRSSALWQAEAVPLKPLLDVVDDDIEWPAEGRFESIRKDFHAFATSLGPHPAAIIRREQWPYPVAVERIALARELFEIEADTDVFVFGMVLIKQSPGSAKGMVFVTLEDETGFVNLALTPQVYARYYRLVDRQAFLCLVGQLQRVNESHSVLVKRVFDTDDHNKLVTLPRSDEEKARDIEKTLVEPRAFH